MNHFEKLHKYINENYTNLPYDLNYYAERGTTMRPKPIDLIIGHGEKWGIKMLHNFLWRIMPKKAKAETLKKFKNLEDQIEHDRFVDKVIEKINKNVDDLAERSKYKNCSAITEEWIKKEFKIKTKKDYIKAIKDSQQFFEFFDSLNALSDEKIKEFID